SSFPTANPFQPSFGGGPRDAFLTKIKTTASGATSLVYSTYLGGSGEDSALNMAVDTAGNAYLTGGTNSADFPTTNAIQSSFAGGARDCFVTKFNVTGNALVYSTYLGGSGEDVCGGITVDSFGDAYVTGFTDS